MMLDNELIYRVDHYFPALRPGQSPSNWVGPMCLVSAWGEGKFGDGGWINTRFILGHDLDVDVSCHDLDKPQVDNGISVDLAAHMDGKGFKWLAARFRDFRRDFEREKKKMRSHNIVWDVNFDNSYGENVTGTIQLRSVIKRKVWSLMMAWDLSEQGVFFDQPYQRRTVNNIYLSREEALFVEQDLHLLARETNSTKAAGFGKNQNGLIFYHHRRQT